jgi:hypothetical protein
MDTLVYNSQAMHLASSEIVRVCSQSPGELAANTGGILYAL